jgi:hypothetical protein
LGNRVSCGKTVDSVVAVVGGAAVAVVAVGRRGAKLDLEGDLVLEPEGNVVGTRGGIGSGGQCVF